MKSKATTRTAQVEPKSGRGILCGTDFSEGALNAVRVAAGLAMRFDEPLILAHAVEMPTQVASNPKISKWMMRSRQKELRQEAEHLRKTAVEVVERTLAGRPDEVLVDLARVESPRMLVVSSIGLRGVQRWLLGSVSERAAERAIVPTLVVREAGPLVGWTHGDRPLKVFVCFNFTATSETALRWVRVLQDIGPCEVLVSYVDWPAEQRARLGGSGPLLLAGDPNDVRSVLERDVREKAGELLGKIPFSIRVDANWGRPDIRLAEMAREAKADLVVVGSHQYQGFERAWHTSVSRGLLHQAAMSVVVVPLAKEKARRASMAPPVRRVLVTTDFSELGDAAVPHAYSILRGGGVVHLLHVIAPPFRLPGGRIDRERPARRSNIAEARHLQECAAKLRNLIPPEAAAQGISTQIEVTKSREVAEGICQAAERLGADLICIGSHGRSGMSKAILGSVAQEVMARSRRPLFVVRSQPR